jgi:hypothetical protein
MGVSNTFNIPNIDVDDILYIPNKLEMLKDFKTDIDKLKKYEFDISEGMLSDMDHYLSYSDNYIKKYNEATDLYDNCSKLFNKIESYSNVSTFYATEVLVIYMMLTEELAEKLDYVIDICKDIKKAIKIKKQQRRAMRLQ